MTSRLQHRSGFTIVELLIVIVVIGILAAITIVAFNGVSQKARVALLQSDLESSTKKLEVFKTTTSSSSSYPSANDCSVSPAAGTICLPASPGTSYMYAFTASNETYCLSATNSGTTYYVSNTVRSPTVGSCPPAQVAITCPTGFVVVPGNATYGTSDFCVMKYEAKNVSGVATSVPTGSPWVNISQTNAMMTAAVACSGCKLITEAEWMTIVINVLSVASNWSGGSVGSGYIYSGHNDNSPGNVLIASSDDTDSYYLTTNSGTSSQRRTLTLTNGSVIWDIAGNVWEWTAGQTTTTQPGSSGYNWRDWNAIASNGSLPVNPAPSAGAPAAVGWNTASQGLGQVYSDSSDTTHLRGFLRGGNWNAGTPPAGVAALFLNASPSDTLNTYGFRVSK